MSNINTTQLNELYPIAGVNNDTQGFRDNFANIKLNLNYAKDEIDILEELAIKKGENSNFDGMELINANFNSCTEKVLAGGLLLDNYQASYTAGQYHIYTIGDNISISVYNWPYGRYAKMMLEITGDTDEERNVSFTGPLSVNNIKYDNNWPVTSYGHSLIVTNSITHVVEFWTADSGTTIFAKHIGRF